MIKISHISLFALVLVLQCGCVRKRLTIRTNPPGAMVFVDKQPIGLTPVSTSFTYYGTRNVEIVRDGFRTERFLRKFNPPWYEIPPLDFFSETLWPFEKRDERVVDVQMTPDPVISNDSLIASGEQLRLQAGQGVAVSPPPTVIPMTSPQPGPTLLAPDGSAPVIPNYPNAPSPASPGWRPGDLLRGIVAPGGIPPMSNPSMEVTPGGGFRPPQ